jgi:TPR repeat protein
VQLTAEAKRGDVAMQNVLGAVLYRRHDLDGAEQWWRAAALGGHDEAAFNLGVLFNNDRGNDVEAEQWWLRASEAGHAGAKHALGILCYQRDDKREAKSWWLEAARGGDQDAIDKLQVLLDED